MEFGIMSCWKSNNPKNASHRLTAVSRGGEKLVEKRLPDGKRRMGFPFKEVFLCLFIRFPSQGQAFHAPARLFVFGWGCAALTEKAGRLPGLV